VRTRRAPRNADRAATAGRREAAIGGGALGIRGEQRVGLALERLARVAEEAPERAQGDVAVASRETGFRFLLGDDLPVRMRAPQRGHEAAVGLEHERVAAHRELGPPRPMSAACSSGTRNGRGAAGVSPPAQRYS
jgi:hypothetical protein